MITTGTLNNSQQITEYLTLVKNKYQNHNHFAYYINDLEQGILYSLNSVHQKVELLRYYDNNSLIAQIALIIDSRLPDKTAWFGFFECPNNEQLFKSLWEQLVTVAKNNEIKDISGPINGTTWHAYRLIKEQLQDYTPFLSDVVSEPFYYPFFKQLDPDKEKGYYTGQRKQTDALIKITAADYQKTLDAGISIKPLEEKNKKNLTALFHLSCLVFRNNWGFISLSEKEFFELYAPHKVNNYIQTIYVVEQMDKLVGFCTILEHQNQWILKTMAILPHFQGKGLGNAMVHKIHCDAREQKVEAMIYALISDTNKIQHFPKDDAREMSRYACFTFKL